MIPEAQNTKHRNFDAIRLGAAASVIFSHAFLIAEGHERNEPLVRILGEHNIIGIYAVFTFLILSGFLVTHSIHNSNNLRVFLWKRFLRIFPGLVACAFVGAFIIAPFFSDIGARWEASEALSYVIKVASMQNTGNSSVTVFYLDENNIGPILNGSLWTIPQEVFCYLLLAVIFAFGACNLTAAIALFAGSTFMLQAGIYTKWSASFIYLIPSFASGMALYFIRKRFGLSRFIFFLCMAALIVCGYLGWFKASFPVFGSYIIIFLAVSRGINFGNATKFGDVSYGTYLYGWPIEQIVRSILGSGVAWWEIFIISLPLALCAGWLSWHLLEKHALALKSVDPLVLFCAKARRSSRLPPTSFR